MANQYRSVLSGGASTGGDAVASEVLTGKTFTNDNGPQTGTMTNNGAVSQTLSGGQSYTIPEGYHNGNGTVTALATCLNNTGDYFQVNTGNVPDCKFASVVNNVLTPSGSQVYFLVNTTNYSSFTASSAIRVIDPATGNAITPEPAGATTADISSYDFIMIYNANQVAVTFS